MSFKEEERQEEQEEQQEKPEPGFRKVDKRHSAQDKLEHEDASVPPDEEAEQDAEPVPEEPVGEEEAEPAAEGIALGDLDVYDTLRFTIGLLAQQAWITMGVQLAPGASELKRDLVQAKVAIDSLEFIIAELAPQFDEREQVELNALLNNLRINYVKKA